jgi:hypothetical protein
MKHCILSLLAVLAVLFLPARLTAQNVVPQKGDKITTSEGIYIVSGDNLIPNPSFDEGFTGWLAADGNEPTSDNFSLEATGGADGGAYIHALSSAGSSASRQSGRLSTA